MNTPDRYRIVVKPSRRSLRFLVAALAAVGCGTLVGCVDLTAPWEKGSPTGGAGGASGLVGSGGGVEGTAGADGASPIPSTGGAGGAIDAQTAEAGGGGVDGGLDSGAPDAPLGEPDTLPTDVDGGVDRGAGGVDGSADSPSDVPLESPPDLPADLPSTGVEAGALLTGLFAYYPCESATGATLPDMSGNGNDGTLTTAASPDGGTATPGFSFVPGKVGNALSLAKAGTGYVAIPPAIFAQATDMTIASWVQVTTAQNWQRLVDVGINANLVNNTTTGTIYMNLVPQTASSTLAFSITINGYGSGNEQTMTAPALSAKVWKHVAVVLGSGQAILYVDGSPVTTSTQVTLRPADLGAINYAFLGKSQFGSDPYFDGLIDEVRVYRRALGADEVAALYQYAGP